MKDGRKDGGCIYLLVASVSSSERLDPGDLVFLPSTATAVDAGQEDQEDKRG